MSGRRVALWAILLIAVVAAVGYRMSVFRKPPEPPVPRVVFITGGSGPYWQTTVNGAKAAALENNVELRIEMPAREESLEDQMAIMAHLASDTFDGVALSPLDADGQTHLINKLAREKRVVTFDSDANLSDRQSHVGTSNFSAGMACGRLVGEALPKGGKVAVLMANQTKQNLVERKEGLEQRLAQFHDDSGNGSDPPKSTAPKYTIVGFFEDGGSDEKCATLIKETLIKNPDLACFVGLNARHGPVLLTVLKDVGKLGKITLVTFDADEKTLDGIEAGHIYATIAQDPYNYGYEAVKTLAALCRGHGVEIPIVGKGSVYVGAEAIRMEELPEFRERLQTRQGKAEAPKNAGNTKNAA